LTSAGTTVMQLEQRRCVDTHWHRGLSNLQIGWRWVFHALAHGKRLFHFLFLDPQPDPDPVFASKAQAARPIAAFDALE
jgi:hypothetical protein